VPVILPVPLVGPDAVIDAVDILGGNDQLYTVFTGTMPSYPFVVGVGTTIKPPLHIVVLNAGTCGFGSIVTSTKNVLPTHVPACGVTV
jgi:hypothetical protein